MTRLSKKKQSINKVLKPGSIYSFTDAVKYAKEFAKNNEGFDVAINLGVDARKSDQNVRGSTLLPKGTGKTVRVAVFAQGENATKALNAGADIVGFHDLAERIKGGDMNFDVVIATPDAMSVVGPLGPQLGPRNLMPNPKVGTVTMNIEAAVTSAKSGQVRYKTDKNGIIHTVIGKVTFSEADLAENLLALVSDLKKAKPTASKGVYIKKVTLSSTQGPAFPIDMASILV